MMFLWDSQTDKQVPPVVDERYRARHDLTGLQLLGDKTAPALLVFRLIEVVFAVGPIAVVAQQADRFVIKIGD